MLYQNDDNSNVSMAKIFLYFCRVMERKTILKINFVQLWYN